MKILLKTLKWTGIAVGALVLGLTTLVLVREQSKLDVSYPVIRASRDPAVIARGRYLAYGPAHCVACHGQPAGRTDPDAGPDLPLSGGHAFASSIGTIRAPNLTADLTTGLGAAGDEEIARVLRHGVGRDGRALMPFMPFANLTDDDLTAIVSFLRTLPAARNPVKARALNPLGRAVMALLIEPLGPSPPAIAAVSAAPSAAYGRYLVRDVANCVGCHTRLDKMTDLTGRVARGTEELFVARFRTGKGASGSPMPWAAFARTSDDDLRAVHRYLRSLPPVENDTGESVRSSEALARAR